MTSYIPNLSRDNIALYTVPAAWVIALAPRFYAVNLYKSATKKDFPALSPREFVKQVSEDPALDSKTKGRLIRAESAQSNSYENLGLFASAVVAGTVAGLAPSTLNGLSLGYLAARFVYNHIYIFNDLLPPQVRTLTYFAGLGTIFAMYIQAGMKINSSLL